MYCSIKTKKGLMTDKRYIDFTLMYDIIVESLGKSITEQVTVSLTELWNIVNEKIAAQGYEIDEIDDNVKILSILKGEVSPLNPFQHNFLLYNNRHYRNGYCLD